MPYLKKLILVCIAFIQLVQPGYGQEAKIFYQAEHISQRVKSILEITSARTRNFRIEKNIIEEFDNNHRFQYCLVLYDGVSDSSWGESIKHFDEKYLKLRTDDDTTGNYNVDMFNGNGERVGNLRKLKSGKLLCKNVCEHGKNVSI